MNILRKTAVVASQINVYHQIAYQRTLLSSAAYRSSLSLETLYPGSSLKLSTPSKPAASMHEKFSGYIPIEKLNVTYCHSAGPGGQNVNKVNTKVDLRFHLQSADWLHDDIKQKLAEKHKNKLTKDGFLVFKSDITRSQQMNTADCLEKLRSAIRDTLYVKPAPTEESLERIRKRKEKAARERLMIKRERSFTKRERQAPNIQNV